MKLRLLEGQGGLTVCLGTVWDDILLRYTAIEWKNSHERATEAGKQEPLPTILSLKTYPTSVSRS